MLLADELLNCYLSGTRFAQRQVLSSTFLMNILIYFHLALCHMFIQRAYNRALYFSGGSFTLLVREPRQSMMMFDCWKCSEKCRDELLALKNIESEFACCKLLHEVGQIIRATHSCWIDVGIKWTIVVRRMGRYTDCRDHWYFNDVSTSMKISQWGNNLFT